MRGKILTISILAFALFLLLSFAPRVSAQFNNGFLPDNTAVQVRLTPNPPVPGENVDVRVLSYIININNANITWLVNGAVAKSGRGEVTFSFEAPEIGRTLTLGVSVEASDGQDYNQEIVIKPAGVSLLWEGVGYTPPFYKGKTLFAHQGLLRVSALAQFVNSAGRTIPSSELEYTWRVNGKVKQDDSGLGKDSLLVEGAIISRALDVDVTVRHGSGLYAFAITSIEPARPSIVLYEKNPRLGIMYNRALSNRFGLPEGEVTISAEPYYVTSASKDGPELSYEWRLNGVGVLGATGSEQIFRSIGGSGTSHITLTASLPGRMLQQLRGSLFVTFGSSGIGSTGNVF